MWFHNYKFKRKNLWLKTKKLRFSALETTKEQLSLTCHYETHYDSKWASGTGADRHLTLALQEQHVAASLQASWMLWKSHFDDLLLNWVALRCSFCRQGSLWHYVSAAGTEDWSGTAVSNACCNTLKHSRMWRSRLSTHFICSISSKFQIGVRNSMWNPRILHVAWFIH